MKKFRKRVIKMAKILGKDNFNDTIANGVTLVDFWAEWCGPCRMQLPILEEVSEEIGEKATVGKINVDHELELAQRFGVQSIPTLILFKDGEIVDKMVGVQAKETLVDKINNALQSTFRVDKKGEIMYDSVIIGSGPAGLTAAIYLSRAGLKNIVINGSEPGGQLTTTTDVENFPGFPKGILGPQLVDDMKTQAINFGTEFLQSNVSKIDSDSKPIKIHLENKKIIETKTVILATGASARYLGIENEKEYIGRGVSACATCDGLFFRGKNIVVIGGGDTAMEEAVFLTKFASNVTIIHRRN